MEVIPHRLHKPGLTNSRLSLDVDDGEGAFWAPDLALNFVQLFVHACVAVRVLFYRNVGVSTLHRSVDQKFFTIFGTLIYYRILWVENLLIMLSVIR